jgi:hypothetical protein
MVLLGRDQCSAGDKRSRLAEVSPLCIPSDPPDNAHASQGELVRPEDPHNGPQVASDDMVLCENVFRIH